MKAAIGRDRFRSPARARRNARLTVVTASAWPTTLLASCLDSIQGAPSSVFAPRNIHPF